jgi:hypothetical protein
MATLTKILGPHPKPPNPFGLFLTVADEQTDQGVPHRILGEETGQGDGFVVAMKW